MKMLDKNHGLSLKELRHLAGLGLQASTNETAHQLNRSMVLELIRMRQGISRADLARLSGLQKSTISIIVNRLLSSGWIRESGSRDAAFGRPSTLVEIDSSLGVIGIDLRPGNSVLAIIDLVGRIKFQSTVQLPSSAVKARERLANEVEALIKRRRDISFQGIGITVPGRVNRSTGQLQFAPNLQWHSLNLHDAFRRTKLPVAVQNAADAVVLSEHWFGSLRGVQNAIVVTVSESIGTGILTDGRLISGWNGMAGEFGHVVLDPSGPVCACGHKGCWEMFASDQAIEERASQIQEKQTKLKTTYDEILGAALDEQSWALSLIEEQYRAVGAGLGLVLPFAPEVVMVAGRLTRLWGRFQPVLEESVRRHITTGYIPKLIATPDVDQVRIRAATAVVLQFRYQEGIADPVPHQATGKSHRRKPPETGRSPGLMHEQRILEETFTS